MSLPLPVAELIDDCNVGPLTVERRAAPTQNEFGAYEPSAVTLITVDPVAAHNLTGRDLLQLPEADRNREVTEFYTKVRLFVADDGQAADVVQYNNRRWRVIKVLDYEQQGAVYMSWGILVDKQDP